MNENDRLNQALDPRLLLGAPALETTYHRRQFIGGEGLQDDHVALFQQEMAARGMAIQAPTILPDLSETVPAEQRYFFWTATNGKEFKSDTPPAETDTSVIELIFNRNKTRLLREKKRPHESFDIHEKTVLKLPSNLRVLRMTGCRIRTVPILPKSLVEFYAQECDFFEFRGVNFSEYPNLIVLELRDGRLERWNTQMPPTLARMNVEGNALRELTMLAYPNTLGSVHAYQNPEGMTVRTDPPEFVNRVFANRAIRQQQLNFAAPLPARNIADDTQNVHDHGVQTSTAKNIRYLTDYCRTNRMTKAQLLDSMRKEFNAHKLKPIVKGFINNFLHFFTRGTNSIVDEIADRMNAPYSMHGTTVDKLVHNLWYRILDFPLETKKTALQRLYEEVTEARGMCTNGFMVRMVNVLQGLDDKIVMKLETRQIMQTRVPLTMKKMRTKGNWKEGEEPWQWHVECFKETCKDLDDCEEGSISGRREWLELFLDGFMDELLKGYQPPTDGHEVHSYRHAFIHQRFEELGLPQEEWAKAEAVAALETAPVQQTLATAQA